VRADACPAYSVIAKAFSRDPPCLATTVPFRPKVGSSLAARAIEAEQASVVKATTAKVRAKTLDVDLISPTNCRTRLVG
jgi:hypothetical protein